MQFQYTQGLETARWKMLRRMHQLNADLQLDAQAAAATGPTSADPNGTARELLVAEPPLSRGITLTKRSKRLTTTPFFLCLLAKPAEEQNRVFAAVSRARAAIERREDERACKGKWCRWVTSALREVKSDARPLSGIGGEGDTGPAVSDRPSSMLESSHRSPPTFSSTPYGARSATVPENGQVAFTSPYQPKPSREETGGHATPGCTSDSSTGSIQSRVRMLQVELECRLRAVDRPPSPPAGTLHGLMRDAKSDLLVGGAADTRQRPSVAVYRTAAHEVNARVGGRGVTYALEEALGFTGGHDIRRLSEVLSGQLSHPAPCAAGEFGSPQPCIGGSSLGPRDHRHGTACTSRSKVLQGSGDGSKRAKRAWVTPGELEACRQLHRNKLEGLLSACAGVMPLTPRGVGR